MYICILVNYRNLCRLINNNVKKLKKYYLLQYQLATTGEIHDARYKSEGGVNLHDLYATNTKNKQSSDILPFFIAPKVKTL